MAVRKILASYSLGIEVQKGNDKKSGDPIFSKKNFSNVNPDKTPDDIYEMAKAIVEVIANPCGDYFVNDSSKLVNA